MKESTLELQQLQGYVAGKKLFTLDDRVMAGEILTFMGPSGSGKSTLLTIIAGVQDAAVSMKGRIVLQGRDITSIPPQQRRVGLLMQDPVLFPHLSVGGNLAFAIPAHIKPKRARQQRVEQALSEVDMAGFSGRDPTTLSGGQQMRIALMRTLLAAPQALLLDEPFAGLDHHLRSQVRKMVFERIREHGLPGILVTHDAEDAEAAGGRVIKLDKHGYAG